MLTNKSFVEFISYISKIYHLGMFSNKSYISKTNVTFGGIQCSLSGMISFVWALS